MVLVSVTASGRCAKHNRPTRVFSQLSIFPESDGANNRFCKSSLSCLTTKDLKRGLSVSGHVGSVHAGHGSLAATTSAGTAQGCQKTIFAKSRHVMGASGSIWRRLASGDDSESQDSSEDSFEYSSEHSSEYSSLQSPPAD